MSQDDFAERLDAVERRLDAAYPTTGAADGDGETIERIEAFAERLADLEAAVEAVEGYVGEIERVDDELEQRADAALAAADGVEERLDAIEERVATVERGRGGESAVSPTAASDRPTESDAPIDGAVERRPDGSRSEPPNEPSDASGVAPADRPNRPDCTCDRAGSTAPRNDPNATSDRAPESTIDDANRDSRPPRGDAASSTPRTITDVAAGGSTESGDQPARAGPGGSGAARAEQQIRQGRRQPPVGTDGGRTADRREESGGVSGWGDFGAESAGRRGRDRDDRDAARRDDGRSWGDSSTETLLDRLRSML